MPDQWSPTRITNLIAQFETSTAPAHVGTDAGDAFVKTLGNPHGPSALVCEYVGTRLAAWLGLPTFDTATIHFPEALKLDYPHGCTAQPGPAFACREVAGRSWQGSADELADVENPEHFSGLIVFDTWTRNCDRYRYARGTRRENLRNVFFSEESAIPGKVRLMAMDHTACFRCDEQLNASHLNHDRVHDPTVFGLFPLFTPFVTRARLEPFCRRLLDFNKEAMACAMRGLPPEWGLDALGERLSDFCLQRAGFVANYLDGWLSGQCGWQDDGAPS